MSFADSYIEKHCLFNTLIIEEPAKDLNMIVVIPCYNEPDIEKTLACLSQCNETKNTTEVIIVINSGENTPAEILLQNNLTEKILLKKLSELSKPNIKFHLIHRTNLAAKHAGAGLARKIGMDEAVRRFNYINNSNGIIVSFDADSLCDKNFLISIEDYYSINPKAIGSTVYFEHPISGNEFSKEIYLAMQQYELYLRYYNQALRFTGYPYAFHTIGSCFNVKASAYCAQGGMNKKQAGEDFYFLQKIIPNGSFSEINNTCIYPSPRPSDRVPFGTGPIIQQLVSLNEGLQTYSLQGFLDLRNLFNETDRLFKADNKSIDELILKQSKPLQTFLINIKFKNSIAEINANSSNFRNFKKRFYKWFNAFKILKYLNFAQDSFYKNQEVEAVAVKLLERLNINSNLSISTTELLNTFRIIERKNPVST